MTLKQAKEDLKFVQQYFPNVTLKLLPAKNRIGDQLSFARTINNESKTFLSAHDNLMLAAISCHGTLQYRSGSKAGLELGKKCRSQEFVELLDLSSITDDIESLENRLNRI